MSDSSGFRLVERRRWFKLRGRLMGGDRDAAELCEFSIVVELRDLEFADEFGVTARRSTAPAKSAS